MIFIFPYTAPDDYTALSRTITLDSDTTSVRLMIPIIDDDVLCEPDERFEIMLTSMDDNCEVTSSPVPVYITDNDRKLSSYKWMIAMCFIYTSFSTVRFIINNRKSIHYN